MIDIYISWDVFVSNMDIVPEQLIVGVMKKYTPRIGYHRDIFMNCVEKVREKIVNTLYIDNFEYNISHYISWMVRNEVIHYITLQNSTPKENPTEKVKEEHKDETLQKMLEKSV